jgi:hypothetical protein
MKCPATGLDVAAFLAGTIAAWFWLKASLVKIPDPFPQDKIGTWRPTETSDFVFPIMEAFRKNAQFNKVAALLTGLAVLFETLGSLAGEWPLWPLSSN